MMKKLLPFIVLFSLIFSISCGNKKAANNGRANTSKSKAPTPEVKTGVAPIADNEIAVIEMEDKSLGVIKIELYSNIAPKMVERFKTLAKEGFYNGLTFHRVSSIVIQGGDPNSKDSDPDNDGQGESTYPDVPAEFSDVPFEPGIVGAARGSDPNSANCQFYITMQRYPSWDKSYTVFGKVIEGMDNAKNISLVQKQGETPTYPVTIKSITIQPK
jgi:peptidylprolyl isomerase